MNATNNQTYSLDEISGLVGLSKRTIRYYMGLGLVARPLGETRGSYYTEEHLQQLGQVKAMAEAGISLDRIAKLLEQAERPTLHEEPLPGQVTAKTHIHLAQGVELVIDVAAAQLSSDQIRAIAKTAVTQIAELKGKK